MSEPKVRWAVRVTVHGKDKFTLAERSPRRALFAYRSDALEAASHWADETRPRLVKITLRPKAKLPEKSLGQKAWESWAAETNSQHSSCWAACDRITREMWERIGVRFGQATVEP